MTDDGFLEDLRAFGQDGRLLWISASRENLFGLFQATGMTSKFLNDARKVWTGQLEEEAARELAERIGSAELAAIAVEEAGGFAFGLQWLGEALWRSPGDVERARDRLGMEMEPPLSTPSLRCCGAVFAGAEMEKATPKLSARLADGWI